MNKALESFGYFLEDQNRLASPRLVDDNFEPSEAYRFFMEVSAFEIDEHFFTKNDQWVDSPGCLWLSECPDLESMGVILRSLHLEGPVITLQNRFDLLGYVDACILFLSDLSASDFLQYLATEASDRRLATLRHTHHGISVLFYVAHGLYMSLSRGFDSTDWIKLGIEVLKNEPEALTDEDSVLSLTPLTQWLSVMATKSCKVFERTDAFSILEMLHDWADMVYQAGIDLCQYGAMEAEAWESMPELKFSDFHPCHSHDEEVVVAERLLFGPDPGDWTFEVRHIKQVSLKCVLFELRDAPGSFPRDPRVPNKISWPPTCEEEDEGLWVKISEREILSQPSTLQSATAYLQASKQYYPMMELLRDTQDDTSAIPLLLLRGERASRNFRDAAPRSRSQPPVCGADMMKHNIHMGRGRVND